MSEYWVCVFVGKVCVYIRYLYTYLFNWIVPRNIHWVPPNRLDFSYLFLIYFFRAE